MGKRRDRRHAALGGGGRRMKLDLSLDDDYNNANDDDNTTAAPQEKNMSISTALEEGGEKTGVESEERDSPRKDSLPGPVQVNPLSLLGQYSDEEEEEEKTLANGSSAGVSAVGAAGRLDEQVADFLADLETSGLLKEDEVVNQEDKLEAEGAILAKSSQDVDVKMDEVSSKWEAVLHKETNEYYYWNKVTGETTWEKPPAYAASEALKSSEPQDPPVEDSKSTLEDPKSESVPAHEALVQEVTTIIEAKEDILLGEQPALDAAEGDQLNDGGSEGIQDAGRDDEDKKETKILLEAKEDSERIDSPSSITLKSHPELDCDSEVTVSEAVTEQGPGEAHRVEESVKLSIIENGEDTENPTIVSISCEDVGDLAHREDGAGLKNSDLKQTLEQTKKYDRQRLLERGEVLAQKFKILAGEALRNLSSKIRLAVESETRLSDCNAMAMRDEAEDWFLEHMDSQLTRLEALLVIEQAASSVEAEQQVLASNVEDANLQPTAERYVHGAQDTQHLPGAVLEKRSDPSAQLRTGYEDMDVDMDVDMETEDQSIVGASAATLSVDHGVPSAMMSSPYESAVPQPVVYMAPPPVPQVVSYVLPDAGFIPPPQSLPTLAPTPLFPVAPLFPSMPSVFPVMQASVPLPQADSWIPPPPPEEEWAPPPLPDQEAPPPPPDEEEPPLPSASDIISLNPSYPSSSAPVLSSRVYYPLETNQASQATTVSDRHDTDGARYGVVDTDNGSTHDNGNGVPPSVVSTGAAAEIATKKSSSKVRVKKRSHSAAIGASRIGSKKVSTLVNKWIAAQEELYSSDEEDDDSNLFDIEALEKKRQKEIEEWRHQTLASGGALENANFQPLGTLDWRERVKRAKKEASKLAAKQEKAAKAEESKKDQTNPSEESNTDVANTTPPKKPDLKELSEDLPPGWEAFWDAASRDVYYGNVKTSETSWDRPV